MADTIGTYYFQLAPSTEGISQSISEALGSAGETGASSFGASFSRALGVGGAVVGGIATAIGGISTAFVSGVSSVAEYGDEIDKMSQKMGISAEAYQEWDAVMQHSGTSMETLKASMKTMATAAQNNDEAFQALGLSAEAVASMSQEDLFAAVIAGLQDMGESTERTYLANQLLGRGATELGALLNTSAEDTQAMKDRVHELGGVLSDDAVKASAAFQDQLQDMQTSAQGLLNNMMSEFLPGITGVMSGLTDIFAGDIELGSGKITEGIQQVLTQITAKLPDLLNVGGNIILALVESIVQNLPSIIQTGMDVLTNLIMGITEMLPSIVSMAAEVIVTIITGLAEAAPELIPALLEAVMSAIMALIDNLPTILDALLGLITSVVDSLLSDGLPILIDALPDIILGIVNFILGAIPQILNAVIEIVVALIAAFPDILVSLVKALPEIIVGLIDAILGSIPDFIEAGIELFVSLIEALPEIITALIEAVPEIIMSLVEAFADAGPDLMESGKNLMLGLIDGIKDMASSVVDTVSDVASSVVSGFKSLLGIASPSKVFAGFGRFIDEGLALGIDSNQDVVSSAMDDLNNTLTSDIQATASIGVDSNYSSRRVAQNGDSNLYNLLAQYLPYLAQESNVNVTLEGNTNGIFNLVKKANNEYKKQTGQSAFA